MITPMSQPTVPALTLPAGAAGSRIVGLGHHQPEKVMTNDDVARFVETNDEWIRSRTGIVTRHVAADDVTVADMATGAARHALEDAGVAGTDVDLVVVATTTATDRSPNTAGRVAYALRTGVQPGASTPEGEDEPDLRDVVGPAVIDVNTACSGFAYAVGIADQAIRAGSARTAVVVGSEKLTSVTDWTDRSTCILTADGAGAAVLQAADAPAVGPVVWGSEPELTPAVRIEAPAEKFAQDGRAVFKWAITRAADRARRVVDASGLTLDDIGVLVAHQANLRIIEQMVKQLGLPESVVVARDIVDTGNTSAASIPLATERLLAEGRASSGDLALQIGFGAGLVYAAQVVVLP